MEERINNQAPLDVEHIRHNYHAISIRQSPPLTYDTIRQHSNGIDRCLESVLNDPAPNRQPSSSGKSQEPSPGIWPLTLHSCLDNLKGTHGGPQSSIACSSPAKSISNSNGVTTCRIQRARNFQQHTKTASGST